MARVLVAVHVDGSLMAPQRLLHGHSRLGVWMRIAILQAVISIVTVLAVLAYLGDPNRDAINFAACGAYSLVDPTIKANETLIVSLKRAIEDPNATAKEVKQSKARLAAVRKSNKAYKSYRSIYRTIPPDYKCPDAKPKKKAK